MASGGAGSCNGVSVGGVVNNSGSSSLSSPSTSTVFGDDGGRMADPIRVAKASCLGRFVIFFRWVLVESVRKEFWPGTD